MSLRDRLAEIPKEYRYLGFLMGLPLADGVFLSIVLSGGLNSLWDAILVGGFVLGGGATIGVILSEFDDNQRTVLKRTLLVSFVVALLAMVQAAAAPMIEPYINTERFQYGAMLALLVLAFKIMPHDYTERLFGPGVIVFMTMLVSIQPGAVSAEPSINGSAASYALLASAIATTISVTTVLARPYLAGRFNPEMLKYGTASGLIAIVFSISGVLPEFAPVAIFAVGFLLGMYSSSDGEEQTLPQNSAD